MDVNTLYRVTGQRGKADGWDWWKVPNENILEAPCVFCEYRIKSNQRERFSTVIWKKKTPASAKGWITSIYTGTITAVPQPEHNEMPHNLGLWFSVKGFIAVIMVFLRTVNAVVWTTGVVFERKLAGDYLNICVYQDMCLHIREGVSAALTDLDGFGLWDWVSWFEICRESLFVLACPPVCVCQWVCLCVCVPVEVLLRCVNLTLNVPRDISPQPSSTIILIDPHLCWKAPSPDNLSSNFSSLSNSSLSRCLTYWAGLKLPPLSLSYTIIASLPYHLKYEHPCVSPTATYTPCEMSWFKRYSNLPLHTAGRTLCHVGRTLQQILQHLMRCARPAQSTQTT